MCVLVHMCVRLAIVVSALIVSVRTGKGNQYCDSSFCKCGV